MLRSPILWKLFATYVALGAVCLVGAGYATNRILVDSARREVEHGLIERARALAPTLERDVIGDSPDLEARVRDLARTIGDRITVIRADGTVIAESDRDLFEVGNHSNRPEFIAAMRGTPDTAMRHSATVGRDLLYAAVPIGAAIPPLAVLRLALPLEIVSSNAAHIRDVLLWAGSLGLLAAVVLGFVVARRLTRPLAEMTEVARRYTVGDLASRVRASSRDEIGELGRALDLMGEELERKIQTVERDREETRALLSAMIEGVIAVDGDERIILVNAAAREIFPLGGTPPEGRSLTDAIRNEPVLRAVTATLRERRSHAFEVTLLDGSGRVLEAQATPIGGARGGCVVVFHDISRLRRLEDVRRDFVANVSHELRTPLTSVMGYVETLLAGGMVDGETSRTFLRKIASNAERLHALITDLLSLSRLESQAEPYRLAPVRVNAVVEKSLGSFRDRIAAKSMTLEVLGERDDVLALADEGGLRQVVDNLLDNAIKYTPDGGRITVEIGGDERNVTLAVKDTGVGIPAPDLPRIFERFYRVDRARSRELGGTGLGLAIVKHVVQALHGTIEVASEPGRGSRFVVTLPRASGASLPSNLPATQP
ncbi:MAG: HAMP domain-containing protein [Planctomycetes bacterium]|nr:HAMP domain-containing protein [Planctomycetota bacterium]MBI3843647.1 HAMP domain-containing protein [Planctomycetota bacterium]